ncbi:MAG: DUF1015 family protein, partial [Flavobacteriales bacterium]
FTTTDRARHTLWTISDPELIKCFEDEYDQIDSLYIADGHHRSASSARLADLRGSGSKKEKAFEHFMAYIIPSSSLTIKGFHRMLKDLNGQSSEEFIEALKKVCELQSIYLPGSDLHKGMMDLYIDSKWYRLDASSLIEPYEPDSSWLTQNVLSPLLNIKDLRTDNRIKFFPGSNSIESIMKAVDSGEFAAGIYMHPVAFSELKHISDNGGTMPPKSTWIEPKLRSGLTIFTFLEEENLAE